MKKTNLWFYLLVIPLLLTGCNKKLKPQGHLLLWDFEEENSTVNLMDLESGEIEFLVYGASGKISPDGETLAFTDWGNVEEQRLSELFVMPIDKSSPPLQFTENEGGAFRLAWSPDSEWIAYDIVLGKRIYIIRKDGSGKEMIYESLDHMAMVGAWTLDENSLIITRTIEAGKNWNWTIYQLEIDNGNLEKLTDYTRGNDAYSLSPDGRYLLVLTNRGVDEDQNRIMVLDLKTGEEWPLIDDKAVSSGTEEYKPIWSPDGKWIAADIDRRICIFHADGELYDCYDELDEYSLLDWGP